MQSDSAVLTTIESNALDLQGLLQVRQDIHCLYKAEELIEKLEGHQLSLILVAGIVH